MIGFERFGAVAGASMWWVRSGPAISRQPFSGWGHHRRQPLQAIQTAYEWLGGHVATMPEKARLERGERPIARLTEQLDRLVGALNLYEHTKSITVSPVALAPLFGRIASENMEAAIEKGRSVAHLPDDGVGDEPSGASGRGSAQPSAQCTQVYGAGGPHSDRLPPVRPRRADRRL